MALASRLYTELSCQPSGPVWERRAKHRARPGIGSAGLSLLKDFILKERVRLQFRAECFNVSNRANFALPVNDLASPTFGRILEAGPARLIQFGLKLMY